MGGQQRRPAVALARAAGAGPAREEKAHELLACINRYIYIYIYICVCVCVRVHVCMYLSLSLYIYINIKLNI